MIHAPEATQSLREMFYIITAAMGRDFLSMTAFLTVLSRENAQEDSLRA
jgi:hypothetical protein